MSERCSDQLGVLLDEAVKIATNMSVVEHLLINDSPVSVLIGPILIEIVNLACLIVGADSKVFGDLIRFAEVKGDERERIWSVFVFRVAAVCNGIVTRGF